MFKITLFVIVAFVTYTNAVYNTLEWASCSTVAQIPAVRFERLSMLPMVK